MRKHKLSELVDEISIRVNEPSKSGYDIFVGLEHFVSGDVKITKYGSAKKMDSAAKLFQRGDILIARRNVYLKRAGIVNFDGLTSGDSIVLRAKSEHVKRLLPFIFNTQDFWDYAAKHADGSMSKRLSPKVLMEYEVVLPDTDEQIDKIGDILWAMEDTIDSYKKMIDLSDELVKSQFIEMFGDIPFETKYDSVELGTIANMFTGGTPSSKHPEYYGGDIPFVSTPCLGDNYIDEKNAQNWLTELGVEKSAAHKIPPYSIMYGSRVGVGKSSINTCVMCTNQDILSFCDIDKSKYNLLFIKKVLDQYFKVIDSKKRGATIKGVTADLVKSIRIPNVSIDIQNKFAYIVEQTDKSKFHRLNECFSVRCA